MYTYCKSALNTLYIITVFTKGKKFFSINALIESKMHCLNYFQSSKAQGFRKALRTPLYERTILENKLSRP